MALGYGYVRDDDPVQINWSEITKNFTDRIKADQVDRQKRKDDIQEKYNDLQKDLINKPQGYNTDLNKVVGSFSGQASTASLDLINKLKSGQISEQEYYTKRANLKSSTENFFLYSKNFNDNYGRLMELARSNDPDKKLSAESMFQLQIASDMLDFKNTTAIVDPGTNELILVKTDEDGNPTDQIVNVSQLGYLSSDEKLSYNYKNLISENLKNRGVKKYTDDKGNIITTIQGVTVTPETANAALDGLAESIVGDQSQMISILAQNGYTLTKDPSKKDDEKTMYYDMNTNEWSFDTEAALGIVTDEINNSISVSVDTSKVLTENEKKLELLKIQDLRNRVEKGSIELKGIRADDIDTSNLQAEVKRDINDTVGSDIVSTFDTNYYSLVGPAKKKGSNAVKASLDLLNRYGSGFGTTITEDGTYMYFTTPAFDASGKQLAKPQEIKYSLENITDGNTVTALLENFITIYPAKRFINNAYKTGRFNQATGTGTQVTGTQVTGTQSTGAGAGTQSTGTQAAGTQAAGTQAAGTTTEDVTQAASDYGIDLDQTNTTTPPETVQTTIEATPAATVIEENVSTQEDSPGIIKAKRRNWIKKVEALLNEKIDGSPGFDKSILQRKIQGQSMENALSVDKKYGGQVADKFLTAEFARLYPDYPHQIYGQTKIFGKAEEVEVTKKQKEVERKKQRKNTIEKGKLFNNYFGEMEELIDLVAKEANRQLTLKEQSEIEKGNLPAIDFSETFKKKYSYLFD